MTTRLYEKAGLQLPCLNPRTGGSGHAQCSVHERMLSAPPRYDVKPVRFALNQSSRKLCSGGVTCPGLIRCVGLEQCHYYFASSETIRCKLWTSCQNIHHPTYFPERQT